MSTKKQTETLVIRRRGGDRIVAVHKLNGETVGRAEVKRYSTDADVFLAGVDHVVEKLTKEEHLRAALLDTTNWNDPVPEQTALDESDPRNLKAGDRVLVRDDLVPTTLYGAADATNDMVTLGGKVLTLSNKSLLHDMWEAKENGRWWSPEMFVGKLIPCGDLKVGDEVLVKGADDLEQIQAEYAGKVIRVEALCPNGCAIHRDVHFDKDRRFVGKLIRFYR